MCLGCLFHDFVDADLVVNITAVERALKQVVNLVVITRNQMILLLYRLAYVWLKADILEPVGMSHLEFDLVQREELDCFNLPQQVLLTKVFVSLRLFGILMHGILGLSELRIVI